MSAQKVMGRAVLSSFLLAGAVILAGAFLAPPKALTNDTGCNSAYGIERCVTEQVATR